MFLSRGSLLRTRDLVLSFLKLSSGVFRRDPVRLSLDAIFLGLYLGID